ncbi:AraC family transcriptional regulator [Ruminococcus sp. AF25-13]|uniref:helix-turn-helix transcriptional regulator n=4 Tax=Lachnospiraceae TaxID=186803 RepID=UPI000E42468F|nr:helix-turn-helix transcriptional regulator [Clostridiales bacterium]RGD84923.1 AraC family transcriptional regulator [Ruminococcus sp. TF10-6]RGF10792.1 AraC family transcriptional regulator [Ruminococcus sp. AM16-34]RGF29482.1 AraC family transcriptional regulator [Ruminococcus sp. AM09-18-1]RGG27651.1 AraC family transcriptional regulator [Ruminococcus sp. AF25-13]RGG36721.1 AraC family transcriptional regulator [Ruminococcus sp. AF24-16]RGI17133.1 AraC family transcriptional regulator [
MIDFFVRCSNGKRIIFSEIILLCTLKCFLCPLRFRICFRNTSRLIKRFTHPKYHSGMNYIRSHTNEPIHMDDVAAQIDRSTSYVTKMFKSELGINPGAYINRCKLEEAKSLLTYTEKSLSEISNYLCYSSQAHFQTAFKKQYGMTPMQYRDKTRQM